MKRINRRLSVHTSSLTQHHELKKHSALPKVKNNKEAIAKHFKVIDIDDENDNLYATAQKILDGFNENEVYIADKKSKKSGFFERFFNFFN